MYNRLASTRPPLTLIWLAPVPVVGIAPADPEATLGIAVMPPRTTSWLSVCVTSTSRLHGAAPVAVRQMEHAVTPAARQASGMSNRYQPFMWVASISLKPPDEYVL